VTTGGFGSMGGRNLDEGTGGFAKSFEQGTSRKGREIEVKFSTDLLGLNSAMVSPLFASASSPKQQKLRTIYFDSPSGDLRKNGFILRIRKNGRAGPILGVKSASDAVDSPFARNEIEVRSRDLEPDLTLFDDSTAAKLTRILGDHPLEAQFETQVNRQIMVVNKGQSEIEVAFDDGGIITGQSRVPLTEIELELKSGIEPDLYDLALQCAQSLPLRLDFVSKGEKGFRTRGKAGAASVKAETIRLRRRAIIGEAATAVLSNALVHFIANWTSFRDTEHPESIHQMRVALRRMRTGLVVFKTVTSLPEFDFLQTEAKRIASALGPARECDAFYETANRGPLSQDNCQVNCEALLAAVRDWRIGAYRSVAALIDDRDTAIFVLKVQRFLAQMAQRDDLSGAGLKPALSTRKFARHALDKLNARVLKRGRSFPNITDEARHRLRISIKKLRYGAEFFGCLFDRPRKMRSYIARISKLQDILGSQNDDVMAKHFLDKLSKTSDTGTEKATGFVLGWYARDASAADKSLSGAWKKFKRAHPFWD
jgi:triphosphatase